jgi:hypothetical protein
VGAIIAFSLTNIQCVDALSPLAASASSSSGVPSVVPLSHYADVDIDEGIAEMEHRIAQTPKKSSVDPTALPSSGVEAPTAPASIDAIARALAPTSGELAATALPSSGVEVLTAPASIDAADGLVPRIVELDPAPLPSIGVARSMLSGKDDLYVEEVVMGRTDHVLYSVPEQLTTKNYSAVIRAIHRIGEKAAGGASAMTHRDMLFSAAIRNGKGFPLNAKVDERLKAYFAAEMLPEVYGRGAEHPKNVLTIGRINTHLHGRDSMVESTLWSELLTSDSRFVPRLEELLHTDIYCEAPYLLDDALRFILGHLAEQACPARDFELAFAAREDVVMLLNYEASCRGLRNDARQSGACTQEKLTDEEAIARAIDHSRRTARGEAWHDEPSSPDFVRGDESFDHTAPAGGPTFSLNPQLIAILLSRLLMADDRPFSRAEGAALEAFFLNHHERTPSFGDDWINGMKGTVPNISEPFSHVLLEDGTAPVPIEGEENDRRISLYDVSHYATAEQRSMTIMFWIMNQGLKADASPYLDKCIMSALFDHSFQEFVNTQPDEGPLALDIVELRASSDFLQAYFLRCLLFAPSVRSCTSSPQHAYGERLRSIFRVGASASVTAASLLDTTMHEPDTEAPLDLNTSRELLWHSGSKEYIKQLSTCASVGPSLVIDKLVRAEALRSYLVLIHLARTSSFDRMESSDATAMLSQIAFFAEEQPLTEAGRVVLREILGGDIWTSRRDELTTALAPWQTQEPNGQKFVSLHDLSVFEDPLDREPTILEWMLLYIEWGDEPQREFLADIITQALSDGDFVPWLVQSVLARTKGDDSVLDSILRYLLRAMLFAPNPSLPAHLRDEARARNLPQVVDAVRLQEYIGSPRHREEQSRREEARKRDAFVTSSSSIGASEKVVRRMRCRDALCCWEAGEDEFNHIPRIGTSRGISRGVHA